MIKKWLVAFVFCGFAATVWGQSRLDGTSFQVSTYNFPDSVGVVRIVDGAGSNCQSEAGTPVGDDIASEECLTEDAGTPPVTMTFGAGPQVIGGMTVTPTVTPFAGVDPSNPILATNNANQVTVPMATWSTSGDLIEFRMRTTENVFPSNNDEDFWGFAATGAQYPNSDPAAEVGFFYDEVLDTHNNFYFWFENANGTINTGYDIFLPVGLGVGRHPTDPGREVVYIFYSDGEVDENTDTLAGGTLDFFSHGSDLNENAAIGNLFFLSDNVGIAADTITGFGIGMLVQPPATASVLGDFNGDGLLTDIDIDLLSAQVGQADLAFDLNGDGAVTGDDRAFWVETLADTFFGDTDLNGKVEFPDFLVLSANFGQAGGWKAGDMDGNGDVAFPDFLQLSANFGKVRDGALAESVPEPSAGILAVLGCVLVAMVRRKR